MLYTRPLVTPLTRPLIGKVLKQFDPLSNDPYLLFDAETSMLGELESPTLDLDASDPATLEVITATRSGVATFTDQAGVIQEAEPNTVRVDWSLGYPAMLIEPSATNLLPYSEDFSNAGWGTSNDAVVTPTNEEAPDGTTNAFNLSGIEGTDGDYGLNEFLTVTPSATYTFSAYFKAAKDSDIGKKVRIRIRRNDGTALFVSQSVILTADWVRHSVTATYFADNTGAWHVITKDTSSPIEQRADECLIWGAQVETGSVATSYIPTSGGSVAERTRNADNLVIDGTAFSDFYNGSEGTFYIEATERTQEVRAGFITGQGTSQFFLYHNGSEDIYSFDGGASITLPNRPVNELFRAAVTYTPTTKTISMNGAVSTIGVHNGNWAAANILNIGWANSQYIQFNGHIKRLIYWPTHSDNL